MADFKNLPMFEIADSAEIPSPQGEKICLTGLRKSANVEEAGLVPQKAKGAESCLIRGLVTWWLA